MLDILSWLVSGYFCDLCDAPVAKTSLDSAGGNRQLRAATAAKPILPALRKQSPRSVPFVFVLAPSLSPRGECSCRSPGRQQGWQPVCQGQTGYLLWRVRARVSSSSKQSDLFHILSKEFFLVTLSFTFFFKKRCYFADLPHSSSGTELISFSSKTLNFHSDKNPRVRLNRK